jgi:hypothetical protein
VLGIAGCPGNDLPFQPQPGHVDLLFATQPAPALFERFEGAAGYADNHLVARNAKEI